MTGQGGETGPRRTRWRFWVVAWLALAWNTVGCLEFALTVTRVPTFIDPLSPQMVDWLDAAPAWSVGAWALGVSCGALGALLLLARSSWAMGAFAVSLIGLAVHQVWVLGAHMPAGDTLASVVLRAVSCLIAAALLFYAWMIAPRLLR